MEFKFDISWLKNPDFVPLVNNIWEKHVKSREPIDILNTKLKRFKKHCKGWGTNIFGTNRKWKLELKNELLVLEILERNGEPTTYELIYIVKIQEELNKMYVGEESYWYQRAHGRLLLEGDQNTAYFYRIANGRKRKNYVHSLDDNVTIIEGTANLVKNGTD
jgi:hypothetical protein